MNSRLFCLSLNCLILFTTLALAGPAKAPGSLAATKKGDALYTQFSLYYEKGTHLTTNYRRGILLPVNTPVTFVKARKHEIVVLLAPGRELTIRNVPDYSGEELEGVFSRTFAPSRVDLSGFTAEEKSAIAEGNVVPGMRKSAVVVAIGYPPKHKTPTLDSNQWRYWSSRFGTFLVLFENDKVNRVQN